MSPDPDDPLAERLFEAARREKPRASARARAVRAVGERGVRAPVGRQRIAIAAAGFVLAAAAGAALMVSRGAPAIDAERLDATVPRAFQSPDSDRQRPADVTGDRSAATATTGSSGRVAEPASLRPPHASSASAKKHVASQQEELALVDRARELLAAGDATAALGALERYDRTPSERSLGAEAELIRIQALAAVGRDEEARQRAARFVSERPNSPLADRARRFAGASSN